ncbi:DUF4157 domain-containing protein [Pseudomonas fontis]|uniref:eCIS core domain-containing protein n=1 Tax=Pseudomonas fontis TaxID=2942633 RepID=UPI003B684A0E
MSVVSLPRVALLGLALGLSQAAVAGCPADPLQAACTQAFSPDLGTLFEDVSKMAASGLAGWLKLSRDTAAAGEVLPIPLHIRAQLEAYYDFQVLDAARFKVGDPQQIDAATAMLQNPDVSAVTLIDIIVFRSAEDAQNNVALWAHELKHVQQYQEWGIEEFAARYTRNYEAVEAPAYEIQAKVSKALRLAGQ